jgi:hypothetical protein
MWLSGPGPGTRAHNNHFHPPEGRFRVRPLAYVFVGLPLALSGCLGSLGNPGLVAHTGFPGGPAQLACYAVQNGSECNFDALTTNSQGNEVTIAVNPRDPMNLVAGAKDYTREYTGGECVWDGIYVTKDGGRTWKDYNIPGSPWLLLTNRSKFELTSASDYWCASDPVVRFGPDGTLYYAVLAYQGDPITASNVGGINDQAFNRVAQIVAVSTDGGDSISRESVVDMGSFPVNFHDREWIDVANDGTVYDTWTTGLLEGDIFYSSSDHGTSWKGPVFLDGTPAGSALPKTIEPGSLYVSAGPEGTVYVSGWGGSGAAEGVYVAKSTNHGATFGPFTKVAGEADKGMNASYRAGSIGMIAADKTRPYAYVTWADTRAGERDVYASASYDGGATWTNATRLNDDPVGHGKDHFFPAISVSPSGIADVSWYDRRNDPQNTFLDLYSTSSVDFGRTWLPNLRVTEVSSDPTKSHHQSGAVFIGDYMDMASSDVAAHPVWVDTRHGKADVFTAAILRTPGVRYPFAPSDQAPANATTGSSAGLLPWPPTRNSVPACIAAPCSSS